MKTPTAPLTNEEIVAMAVAVIADMHGADIRSVQVRNFHCVDERPEISKPTTEV